MFEKGKGLEETSKLGDFLGKEDSLERDSVKRRHESLNFIENFDN